MNLGGLCVPTIEVFWWSKAELGRLGLVVWRRAPSGSEFPQMNSFDLVFPGLLNVFVELVAFSIVVPDLSGLYFPLDPSFFVH